LVKLLVLQVWVVKTPDGQVPLQQAVLNAMIRWFGRIDGGWAYTALYIGFWWAILWLLYRKRVFLKV
jgi:predicted acyltransferase